MLNRAIAIESCPLLSVLSGGLRNSKKGFVLASLSRDIEKLALASFTPQTVNKRFLSRINFLDNSKVVDFLSLRSMLEAKACILTPAEPEAHFAKDTKEKCPLK